MQRQRGTIPSAFVRQRTEETPVGAYHFFLQGSAKVHDGVCARPVMAAQAGIR
jgi:hypothetical protein